MLNFNSTVLKAWALEIDMRAKNERPREKNLKEMLPLHDTQVIVNTMFESTTLKTVRLVRPLVTHVLRVEY